MHIVINTSELDALAARLDKLGADLSKPMRQVALRMEQEARQAFRDETDPWGTPWPPHSPLTLELRQRRGNASLQKLIDTGAMFDSIGHESGTHTASVSANDPAEAHHLGAPSRNMPPRAFFPIRPTGSADPNDRWWDAILPPVLDALDEALK